MAYADIGDKSSGDTFTEAMWDQIRANFQASAVDIVTTKGDLAVATAADTLSRLAVGDNEAMLVADSSETTGLRWQIMPSARVSVTDFDPAVSSWDAVEFDTETWDTDALHDPTTNTERLTIPANGDGIYQISGYARFATGDNHNGASEVGVRIMVNGTTDIGGQRISVYRSYDTNIRLNANAVYDLDAAEFVEFHVWTDRDVNVSAAAFSIVYQRGPA